jgi:hypothetical protein
MGPNKPPHHYFQDITIRQLSGRLAKKLPTYKASKKLMSFEAPELGVFASKSPMTTENLAAMALLPNSADMTPQVYQNQGYSTRDMKGSVDDPIDLTDSPTFSAMQVDKEDGLSIEANASDRSDGDPLLQLSHSVPAAEDVMDVDTASEVTGEGASGAEDDEFGDYEGYEDYDDMTFFEDLDFTSRQFGLNFDGDDLTSNDEALARALQASFDKANGRIPATRPIEDDHNDNGSDQAFTEIENEDELRRLGEYIWKLKCSQCFEPTFTNENDLSRFIGDFLGSTSLG